MKGIVIFCLAFWMPICIVAQDGSAGDPFTSIDQASIVRIPGQYYFNLNSISFQTYIDANGYVLVLNHFNWASSAGGLTQTTTLSNTSTACLPPAALAELGGAVEARILTSDGLIDVRSSNSTILSRIVNNSYLGGGVDDNAIMSTFSGTGSNWITAASTCFNPITSANDNLNERVIHTCGNVGGMHWIPATETFLYQLIPSLMPTNGVYASLFVKGSLPPITDTYVNLSYSSSGSNDGHLWGFNAFNNVEDGIAAVIPGGTVHVDAGIYTTGRLLISKDLTLLGADSATTVLMPGVNGYGTAYDTTNSFIFIGQHSAVAIRNFRIDCSGKSFRHGVQSWGVLDISNCVIQHVKTSAATYDGRGISFHNGTGNIARGISMHDIYRIGIHVRGHVSSLDDPDVAILHFNYTGKGAGDWLDYGVEFGGGGTGSVDSSWIEECLGVASVDGSTSAGILLTDYWGSGTGALVTYCEFSNNSEGIAIGFGSSDQSQLTAIHNRFLGTGAANGIASTGVLVNARENYWGGTAYLHVKERLSGAGQGNILFDPWCDYSLADCNFSVSGGPVIFAAKVRASAPGIVVVPVTVTDFDHVDSIYLQLRFDPLMLSYQGATLNPALTGAIASVSPGGLLTLSWTAASGLSLADNTTLADIEFNVSGVPSLLTWDDTSGSGCVLRNARIDWPYADTPSSYYYRDGWVSDIEITLAGTDPCCPSLINGQVDLSTSGGIGPYTYSWSNGLNTEDIGGLPQGLYSVTVTDAAGVVIEDSIALYNPSVAPVITFPFDSDSTIDCLSSAVPPGIFPTVTDACGNLLQSPSGPVSGGTYGNGTIFTPGFPGTITYTYTFTDCAGNSVDWVYEYSLEDTVDPVFSCPPDVNVRTNQACTAIGVDLGIPSGSDNCAILSFSNDAPAGNVFPVGTTAVTWIATDYAGNTATCTQNVTVDPHLVSGNLYYHNLSRSPLSNDTVNLYQGNSLIASSITDASGHFEFTDICSGTYYVEVGTARQPASINASDAAMISYWGISTPYAIEKVRFLAGDPNADFYISSGDAAQVLNYFVSSGTPLTPFASDWVYWLANDPVQSNLWTGNGALTLDVGAVDITRDIFALITGDFNQSYMPGPSFAGAGPSLSLSQGQVMLAGPSEIVDLRVRSAQQMSIGALSIILNYPDDRLEILDVHLSDDPGLPLVFLADKGELRIGWTSQSPWPMNTGDILLTITVKTPQDMNPGEELRFTLAPNPLNELANARTQIISPAELYIGSLVSETTGLDNIVNGNVLGLKIYPNPFDAEGNIAFNLPGSGNVVLEITDLTGKSLRKLIDEPMPEGSHTFSFPDLDLSSGLYLATLKLDVKGRRISSTLRMIKL